MRSDDSTQSTSGHFPKILGRPGQSPKELGLSMQNANCPDILRLDDHHFIVIGTDVTVRYAETLPSDTGCADYERIVRIPETTLQSCIDGILRGMKHQFA